MAFSRHFVLLVPVPLGSGYEIVVEASTKIGPHQLRSPVRVILADPGAVSRIGSKGGTKVFKYGRKSPWVPTLTELFQLIQADAGS